MAQASPKGESPMPDSLPIPLTSPLSRAQQTSLVNLVRRAAKTEIMPHFRNLGHADISAKADRFDLVTAADVAAEAMLARGIQQLFPHALVVGEEAAAEDPSITDKLAEAELAFIIDPVDGTWNYAHGLSLFGVILSATRFGRPVWGLLYDPVMDDWITADEGSEGAVLARSLGADRPLSVSRGAELSDLSGFVPLYALPEEKRAALAETLPRFAFTTALRCACHHYRTLAQGGMDFLLSGPPKPWDHAAGVLITQKAGGVSRMLDGSDFVAGKMDSYVLTAPDEQSWTRLRDTFSFLLD